MEHPPQAMPDDLFENDDPSPSILDAERLGRYQLRREIGRGFSSVVFEALDLQRRRTVALKVLTFLQNLSPDRREDLSERFAREARAISALSHPGIVAIYEVGHADDGREFIAMEHLPGETLRARLQHEGTLLPEEAITITLQIADALQYAHDRGIIHRDVKPDNVFVLPDGRVKLMDFGVAHVLSDEALTQTGTVVGSPAYMSPEQINGEHLDGRSDVFSLGVVLAEMIVGHKPFEAPTIPAVMHRILNRPPQMEAVHPRALRKILEKTLSKNRLSRFQSAGALADALRRQVLPELPLWEPTSTMIMPVPSPASLLDLSGRDVGVGWERPNERRSPSRLARWGLGAAIGTTLAALLSLGFFHPPARLTDHPPTSLLRHTRPVALASVGVIRHIPAYWRRLPASASHRAGRVRWTVKSQAAPPTAPLSTSAVRIMENRTPVRSVAAALPAPIPSTAPAVPAAPHQPAKSVKPQAPRLAVAATFRPVADHSVADRPSLRLRPLVVKVGDFRQEQTLAPPIIAADHSASPTDQDEEQISPADAPPSPPVAEDIPDSGPRLLHRTAPLYPRAAWAASLTGTTTLRVFVDSDGNVTGAIVLQSAGAPVLDRAARRTVQSWEFEPAFRGGQSVPGHITERITFSP